VFYELFTGEPPFESSQYGTIEAIRSEQPKPPSEIAKGAAPVDDILLQALAKEKPDRYDNIESLRNDIEKVFNDYTPASKR
jgi:serine/threonine protein kinase